MNLFCHNELGRNILWIWIYWCLQSICRSPFKKGESPNLHIYFLEFKTVWKWRLYHHQFSAQFLKLPSELPVCVFLLFTLLCRLVCSRDVGGMEEKVKKKKKHAERWQGLGTRCTVEEMRGSEEEEMVVWWVEHHLVFLYNQGKCLKKW